MLHGGDGVGTGAWSEICLEEVMVEHTVPELDRGRRERALQGEGQGKHQCAGVKPQEQEKRGGQGTD